MSAATSITVYNGPLAWFDKETAHLTATQLSEHIASISARSRVIRVLGPEDATPEESATPRPENVVATSHDYSTLTEAWVNDFVGLVTEIDPVNLHLQNPPSHVVEQLDRVYGVKQKSHTYPKLTIESLSTLRRSFDTRVIGQTKVRERLIPALYRLASGSASRPVVLMFYGPSGVGKTETARLINEFLGGTLLRIQFSMYHSDKFASYIFGGSHSERSLAHDLLDRESGVILIDEFDKAHSTFHSAFYELFDEGIFVDKNYRVHLGPALIICTSNYASEREVRRELGEALASRFTAMIKFSDLSRDAVRTIADNHVDSKYAALTPDEAKLVDIDVVRRAIHATDEFVNARTIAVSVDEIISHLLVHEVLNEHERSRESVVGRSQQEQ